MSTSAPSPSATSLLAWLPVVLYVALIFGLSSQPRLQPVLHFRNGDKVMHLLEYAGLGLLTARAFRRTAARGDHGRAALATLSFGILVAVCDEVLQSFVPGRDATAFDVVADIIGLSFAMLLYLGLARD